MGSTEWYCDFVDGCALTTVTGFVGCEVSGATYDVCVESTVWVSLVEDSVVSCLSAFTTECSLD